MHWAIISQGVIDITTSMSTSDSQGDRLEEGSWGLRVSREPPWSMRMHGLLGEKAGVPWDPALYTGSWVLLLLVFF